jgi:hypothetical protein
MVRIRRGPSWGWLALLLGGLLAGCVQRVHSDSATFHRLTSPRFTLYTDLTPYDAQGALQELEVLLTAFLQCGWENARVPSARINVVVLGDRQEFKAYAPDQRAGGYYVSTILFEPWIVLESRDGLVDLELLKHELTHYIAFQVMPYQPRWLAEGLAGYFQGAELRPFGKFVLGEVPRGLLRQVRTHGLVESDLLFDLNVDPFMPGFYGTSWLLVHYLMSQRGEQFVAYQDALASGRSHSESWSSIFPDLRGWGLDQQLRAYLERGKYDYFKFSVPAQRQPTHVWSMKTGEVEALRAALWTSTRSRENLQNAMTHVAAALRADSLQPMALALHTALIFERDPKAARRSARLLSAARPLDWQSWLTLAGMEEFDKTDPLRPGALDRALQLAPQQPFALILSASKAARAGEREKAIARAEQATLLAPGEEDLWWVRAALLAKLGACEPLSQVAQRLRQIGHSRLSPRQVAKLDRFARDCGRARQSAE